MDGPHHVPASSEDGAGLRFTGEFCIPGQTPRRILDDHVERYRFACRYVRGSRVLDIACGTGYGSALLADAGASHVDGVDLAGPVVEYARERYRRDNLRFQVGDITTYASAVPYDVAVCFETIEHVPDCEAAVRSLHTLLRPGGHLIVSTPNRPITSPDARSRGDRPLNSHHIQEFTIPELRQLLEREGFEVSPSSIWGQRQQLLIRHRLLRRVYNRIARPALRTSPVVRPVRFLTPRYFVLVARRAGAAVPPPGVP